MMYRQQKAQSHWEFFVLLHLLSDKQMLLVNSMPQLQLSSPHSLFYSARRYLYFFFSFKMLYAPVAQNAAEPFSAIII